MSKDSSTSASRGPLVPDSFFAAGRAAAYASRATPNAIRAPASNTHLPAIANNSYRLKSAAKTFEEYVFPVKQLLHSQAQKYAAAELVTMEDSLTMMLSRVIEELDASSKKKAIDRIVGDSIHGVVVARLKASLKLMYASSTSADEFLRKSISTLCLNHSLIASQVDLSSEERKQQQNDVCKVLELSKEVQREALNRFHLGVTPSLTDFRSPNSSSISFADKQIARAFWRQVLLR
jgi:hypothetical protein